MLDGWRLFNVWDHSRHVADLYRARIEGRAEEMTCAAQAVDLLAAQLTPGDTVLDIGCGSGYFIHSLRRRQLDCVYFGVDATDCFIQMGRAYLPALGVPAENLITARIEDLNLQVDHVVCMNVITNLDNFHRPLERCLHSARKSVILRESLKEGSLYRYVRDDFLDEGVDLKVHVNAYDRCEVMGFIRDHGFDVHEVTDRRTGGKPEQVINYPHYWSFLVATRR